MITAAQRATVVPPNPPTQPRLSLAATHERQAVLDGGWWPRSSDPVQELPGLVLALGERYGPIRRLMLNRETWDGTFRRLAVGTREVRVGWFSSVEPGTLIATTDRGEQIDLLVVPPGTSDAVAGSAMAASADPANRLRAAAILSSQESRERPHPAVETSETPDNPGTPETSATTTS